MADPPSVLETGPSSARNAFGVLLGMRTLRADAERADVALTVAAEHLNDVGIVHGGAVFALADQAMAVAANADGRIAVAATFTIHFLKPARTGDEIVASARPVRVGRSVSVFTVDVKLGDVLLATALGQAVGASDPTVRAAR
jgi:acyl-CoA thioesterase